MNRQAFQAARNQDGRIHMARKDARFWPAVGVVLDMLATVQARVSEAAELLGTSTANLIDFLRIDPKVWEQANILRQALWPEIAP